jgi:hypothetical protein
VGVRLVVLIYWSEPHILTWQCRIYDCALPWHKREMGKCATCHEPTRDEMRRPANLRHRSGMSINLPFWKTEYRRWVHGMEMWLRTSAAGSGARVVMLVGEPQPHCLAAISAISAIYQPHIRPISNFNRPSSCAKVSGCSHHSYLTIKERQSDFRCNKATLFLSTLPHRTFQIGIINQWTACPTAPSTLQQI